MAKGRELKGRIKSFEGMRKITSTMEMVAASKLKRAQDRVVAARPYARALASVIADLYSPDLAEHFPLLRQPAQVKRAAILLLTSNRGLAGGFNSSLIREAQQLKARLEHQGAEVYAKYNSPLSTPPVAEVILPVTPPVRTGAARDYLLYPDARTILQELLPAYVRNAVYRALVETACGEQGARRTAMKNATDNAGDLIDTLTRTYNRARQAQITQEIAEIVGGAEALNG